MDDRNKHYVDDESDIWIGRIIVMIWLFSSGAAAGWIAHRLIG